MRPGSEPSESNKNPTCKRLSAICEVRKSRRCRISTTYRTIQFMIPACIGVFFDSCIICSMFSVCLAARQYSCPEFFLPLPASDPTDTSFSHGCHVPIQKVRHLG